MHVPTVFPEQQTRDLRLGFENWFEVSVMVVNEEGCVNCTQDLIISMPAAKPRGRAYLQFLLPTASLTD